MLQNIHIQNFRAFEDFKAEGFERINLIGGKNNSGKSCLLEAILVTLSNNTLSNIASTLRNEIDDNILFEKNRNPLINSKISFSGKYYEKIFKVFNINEPFNKDKSGDQVIQPELFNVNYINQDLTLPVINQITSFDTIQINKLDKNFADILKIVDPRIENLRSYSSKGNKLYVQTNHSVDLPISSFGDSVKNLVNYFIPIFEKKALGDKNLNILLIDEIENGLHYTAHYDFWKKLFQLSKSENVQVFATTHSLEMIQAFNKVAKEEGEGAYFEMGREFETGKIFISKHDTELLEYELNNEDATFRGE